MALVLGTNSGFVTSAPSADPGGSYDNPSGETMATGDTTASGGKTVTEMGIYFSYNTAGAVDLYYAIYDDSSGVPGALNSSTGPHTSSTGTGWKVVTGLSWSLSGSTDYWLAVAGEAASTYFTDYAGSGGNGMDSVTGSLPDPYNGGSLQWANGMLAIYALVTDASGGTNIQINIGDVWKTADAMQINIGDVWKSVSGMQVNIGDTWKTIF